MAACAACADACPSGAVTLCAHAAPTVDADACNGCGACAAACPEAALHLSPRTEPVAPAWRLACSGARSGGRRLEANCACLNALSLDDLADAWSAGVRVIAAVAHDCDRCPRAGAPPLEMTLARFNRLLRSRGLERMRLVATAPPRRFRGPGLAPTAPRRTRRRLIAILDDDAAASARTLARLLARGAKHPEALYPFSPVIDPDKCTGCDACIRGCPTGALDLRAGPPDTYLADPARCSGCGMCVAMCDVDAVSVLIDAPAAPAIELDTYRCPQCKVASHRPTGAAGGAATCPVCAARGEPRPDILVL